MSLTRLCRTFAGARISNLTITAQPLGAHIGARRLCSKVSESDGSKINLSATHKPDNLERRMLVWTGKYKTVDEVPGMINQEVMERARNRIRIRLANILMFLTFVGCVISVVTGKQAADRGETVQQRNLDWHKEYNQKSKTEDEYAKKLESIAASQSQK